MLAKTAHDFIEDAITESIKDTPFPRQIMSDVAAWVTLVDVIAHLEDRPSVQFAMYGVETMRQGIQDTYHLTDDDLLRIALRFKETLATLIRDATSTLILQHGKPANAQPI